MFILTIKLLHKHLGVNHIDISSSLITKFCYSKTMAGIYVIWREFLQVYSNFSVIVLGLTVLFIFGGKCHKFKVNITLHWPVEDFLKSHRQKYS